MTEGVQADRVPAREWRSRWPGLIWAIPLAALIVAIYLGLHAFAERGIDVVVTFPSAEGVKPASTRVMYLGIEAGTVTGVNLNKDGHSVDVTLNLIPRARPILRTGTVFFLVGVKPDLADPSTLRSAISGVTVGVFPSRNGKPTRHFIGLEKQPAVAPGTPGTIVRLWSDDIGSVRPDTNLTYHGTVVGKVTDVGVAGYRQTPIAAIVQAPYDRLLRPDSVFWNVGALDLAVTPNGVSTHVDTSAVLGGEIAFSTPAGQPVSMESKRERVYKLYSNEGRAMAAIRGPEVLYQARFPEAVGNLADDAPVSLGDIPVGRVRKVQFQVDETTGAMATTVTIGLSPHAFGLDAASGQGDSYWRRRTDALLGKMTRRGLRVALRQSPPVIGARSLELQNGAPAASVSFGAPYPMLPVAPGSGDIVGKADRLLDKLNNLPLAAIGANVERATAGVAKLANAPQLADAVAHADSAIAKADAIMGEVRPKVGPLVASLKETADRLDAIAGSAQELTTGDGPNGASIADAVREMTDTARSLRALTDYLGRHPEAILKGKRKDGKK